MGSNSINIGWNEYEIAILINAFLRVKEGNTSMKDAISEMSLRLRNRILKLGMTIGDTYRDENEISLQMSAICNEMGEVENGIISESTMFRDVIQLYHNDKTKYNQLLDMANAMYPLLQKPIESVKESIEKEKAYLIPIQTSFLAEAPVKYINSKIKHILETKFPNGYRLGSRIETKKLIRYYQEEYGYKLKMDMTDIDEDVKACGIVHETRVYLPSLMLSSEDKEKLTSHINNLFNEGKSCIFYSVLFEDFRDSFLDNQIYDENMLKEYLSYNGEGKWFFRSTYFSNERNAETNILADVVEFVKEQGIVVSEDDVVNGLSHLPEQSVRRAFNERETGLISSGRKQRFHIDNFVVSKEELAIVESIITKAIELYEYISFGELIEDMRTQASSILDNNAIFTEIGIKKVLAIKLANKFAFVNNLISSKDNPISTEDAYRSLAKRETFTNEDVNKLGYECDSLPNVYIDLLLQYSVRINENEYVSKSKVSFDIEKIDAILSQLITKDYIAINDIETLSVFPDCGYHWTTFLLESYVYNHSKLFKLLHAKYFSQTVSLGGIVRKSSAITDFDTMVANAINDDNVPLKNSDIVDYMYDKIFIAQHRYKDVVKVIDKVRKLKK